MTAKVPRRFEITVLKNKSGTDAAQVPAAATIALYQCGATVHFPVFIPAGNTDPVEILVFNVGGFIVGDTFQVNGTGVTFTVDDVVSTNGDSKIITTFSPSVDYTIPGQSRLIITSRRPLFYLDPTGTNPSSSSLSTDASTGRAAAFVVEERFDHIVSGSGITPSRIYADGESGPVAPRVAWLNVRDFRTLQDAVNAIPAGGGTVYLPADVYAPNTTVAFNPPLILPYDRPVRLLGDGPGNTVLHYGWPEQLDADMSLDFLHITGDYQEVEGLSIVGAGMPPFSGSGVGIRVRRDGGTTNVLLGIRVANCHIYGTPGDGIKVDDAPRNVDGTDVPQLSVWSVYDHVEITRTQSGNAVSIGRECTAQLFKNCYIRYSGAFFWQGGAGILTFPPEADAV